MHKEHALIPVNIIICPKFLFRIAGIAALSTFTGPKKLVSNCSRTNVCVRADAASSSTVPMRAIPSRQYKSSAKFAESFTFTRTT